MIANRQKSRVHLGAALLSFALFSAVSLALVVAAGTSATLAGVLAGGGSLIEAALLANYAAGIVVAKLGTATATMDEVLDSIGS